MSTHEERIQKGMAGGRKRWEGKTAKERSAFMSWMAARPRPNRRIEERCQCGRFSRVLAEKRGHLCGKVLEERLAVKNGR